MGLGLRCCIYVPASLVFGSFAIATLIIAYRDGDDTCQGDDSTLSLRGWLMWYGWTDVGFVGVSGLIVLLAFTCDTEWGDEGDEAAGIGVTVAAIVWVLVKLALAITGTVILIRSHWDCTTKPLGEMALSDLAVWWLLFAILGCAIIGSLFNCKCVKTVQTVQTTNSTETSYLKKCVSSMKKEIAKLKKQRSNLPPAVQPPIIVVQEAMVPQGPPPPYDAK